MKRIPTVLVPVPLLVALVAGCGSEGEPTAVDPTSTPTSPTASASAAPEIEVVTGPDTGPASGGGAAEQQATRVTTSAEQASYAATLPDALQKPFLSAVAEHGVSSGEERWAQTVHVGCAVPSPEQVEVEQDAGGTVTLTAAVKEDRTVTCYVATRSLAIATLSG